MGLLRQGVNVRGPTLPVIPEAERRDGYPGSAANPFLLLQDPGSARFRAAAGMTVRVRLT